MGIPENPALQQLRDSPDLGVGVKPPAGIIEEDLAQAVQTPVIFSPQVIPGAVFANYYWVQSAPFWGEDVKGMKTFLDGFKAHGGEARPDFYVLASYMQGLVMVEAIKKAIESKDLTRAGFMKAVQSIDGFDAGGLGQPLSLTKVPYVTGTRTRVLKPDMEKKSWTVVAPYASPKS